MLLRVQQNKQERNSFYCGNYANFPAVAIIKVSWFFFKAKKESFPRGATGLLCSGCGAVALDWLIGAAHPVVSHLWSFVLSHSPKSPPGPDGSPHLRAHGDLLWILLSWGCPTSLHLHHTTKTELKLGGGWWQGRMFGGGASIVCLHNFVQQLKVVSHPPQKMHMQLLLLIINTTFTTINVRQQLASIGGRSQLTLNFKIVFVQLIQLLSTFKSTNFGYCLHWGVVLLLFQALMCNT